jgi:hypothetical protein
MFLWVSKDPYLGSWGHGLVLKENSSQHSLGNLCNIEPSAVSTCLPPATAPPARAGAMSPSNRSNEGHRHWPAVWFHSVHPKRKSNPITIQRWRDCHVWMQVKGSVTLLRVADWSEVYYPQNCHGCSKQVTGSSTDLTLIPCFNGQAIIRRTYNSPRESVKTKKPGCSTPIKWCWFENPDEWN